MHRTETDRYYQTHHEEGADSYVDVFLDKVELWSDGDMIASLSHTEATDLAKALNDASSVAFAQD
jgi:hypothetical protein